MAGKQARLDTLLQEIKRHLKADKLVLEEYGYGFRVDTLKINDENVGGLCVEYKIYSYGPNRKDDKLKYLPFNQDPIGDGRLEVSFKEISFWDYLFMDKDFDIVCLYQKYCFDCRDKMLLDRMVLDPKAGSLNLVYSKEMMKYQPGKPVEMDYDELYEQFNLALSKIQGRLEEKYPGNAVKDLAFNYNGKSVKCLCKYKLSASQVAEIEKLLTGELNNATKNIGMAAFYMRVPTVSE